MSAKYPHRVSVVLSTYEKALANYLVDHNKAAINRISPDCISPLAAIRTACKATAEAIGRTELKSQQPVTHDQWLKITRWINQTFFN